MKQFFIILVLLTHHAVSHAQFPNMELALKSGLAIPMFDFSKDNLKSGSFALPGFTGSAEVKVTLNNRWSGYIQGGLQLNPIDVGRLGYEKVMADPFLEDLYIRSDPFKVVHIVGGPGYLVHMGKSFLLEGKLAAGMFFSSTPYQLYKARYALVGIDTYEITRSSDISVAYGAEIRAAYQVTPWYRIGISTQVLHSQAAFDFISGLGPRTEIRNITICNTSLSLIMKLFPGQE